MQTKADAQLLREYVQNRSEAAFGELVARYTDLIYSAVLRQGGSAYLAEEVAQSVFTDLARKAPSLAKTLSESGALVGWLYRGSRYALAKHLRTEHRRHNRETQAMQDFDPASTTSPDWERVRPVLDDALADLSEQDRRAMLLRFFQNRGYQAVGDALGISDAAAQKRVGRALEKLRVYLSRRGITTTAAMLSAVLSSNAIQTAPAGLAAQLAGASLAGAAVKTGTTLTTFMTITSFKTGIVATGIAAALAVWVAEEHRTSVSLQQENAALRDQIAQLQQAPPSTPALMTDANMDNAELEKLRAEHAELLRLRDEMGRLRNSMQKKQSELAAVTSDRDKYAAVEKARAMSAASINNLKQIGLACFLYAQENGDKLPTNFSQIENSLSGLNTNSGFGTNSYQFYDYGQALPKGIAPYYLLARESEPRQSPDGTVSRTYLMADGSVQEATPDNGDFDAWEKEWVQKMAIRFPHRQTLEDYNNQAAQQTAGQPSQ
ncbi:MAG TPA: sigma-70 family RNA polymerase sigma factor [Verrucomicrobiae bacterium]|jgi:RNA polymerase sigma factor (sigma-70 family)